MKNILLSIAAFASLASLSGCSNSVETPQPFASNYSETEVRKAITQDAKKLGITDGFYFGEESRNFKTAYGLTSPELKADWALAYVNFLSSQNEDMMKDWKSYVPYSKRAEFAEKYWAQHDPEFSKQSKKMKIVWMHEALLDGSELWFRAIEKLSSGKLSSVAVLTHDEEQRMVSKYAENERSEGSLSTQFR